MAGKAHRQLLSTEQHVVQFYFGHLPLGSSFQADKTKALILLNEDFTAIPYFSSCFLISSSVTSGGRLPTKSWLHWVKFFSPGFLKFFRSIVQPSFWLLACCPFAGIGGGGAAAGAGAGAGAADGADDASSEYGFASPS